MSVLLSSQFSGGGSGLIFPSLASQGINIQIKNGSSSSLSNSAAFWSVIDANHSTLGYVTTSLTTTQDTTEQTIIDLSSQAGVLTHVICPELSASGEVTVRITIDGKLTTITSFTLAFSAKRFCMGGFITSDTTATAGDGAGYGSSLDDGYSTSAFTLMINPLQSVVQGLGIPYKESCKVTIQGSVAPEAGDTGKAAACHTRIELIGA